MTTERMLMNPYTGSVAPESEWRADFENVTAEQWGGESFEDGELIEVVRNTLVFRALTMDTRIPFRCA